MLKDTLVPTISIIVSALIISLSIIVLIGEKRESTTTETFASVTLASGICTLIGSLVAFYYAAKKEEEIVYDPDSSRKFHFCMYFTSNLTSVLAVVLSSLILVGKEAPDISTNGTYIFAATVLSLSLVIWIYTAVAICLWFSNKCSSNTNPSENV